MCGLPNQRRCSSRRQAEYRLICADELGWQEPGFAGSDFNETPHLDRLAKQGMVFTQAYATAGNGAPSRACLLSGQYTPRHGVYAVARIPLQQLQAALTELLHIPIHFSQETIEAGLVRGVDELAADAADGSILRHHQPGKVLGEMPSLRNTREQVAQPFDGVLHDLWNRNDAGHDVISWTAYEPAFMKNRAMREIPA